MQHIDGMGDIGDYTAPLYIYRGWTPTQSYTDHLLANLGIPINQPVWVSQGYWPLKWSLFWGSLTFLFVGQILQKKGHVG